MAGGKLFQIGLLGPATANDLLPCVDLARGTWSFQVSADLIPERQSPVCQQKSAFGAWLFKHLWASALPA